MDLGFSGLIEEFEKRLGKPITNIIICCLALGIVIWVLLLLIDLAVKVDEILNSWPILLSQIVTIVLFTAIFIGIIKFLQNRSLRYLEKRSEEFFEKADKVSEDISKKRENADQTIQKITEFQETFPRNFIGFLRRRNLSFPDLENEINELWGQPEEPTNKD